MKVIVLLLTVLLVGACSTSPKTTTDFRLQFLQAVQVDCAVDKAEMNGEAVRVKCFQQVEEKW